MHENTWGRAIFPGNLMFSRLYKFDGSIFGGHIFRRRAYIRKHMVKILKQYSNTVFKIPSIYFEFTEKKLKLLRISPFMSQLLWKKIEPRDRNQNYCSSGCWPFFIIVPQAVNELPSQHWTKRARIVRWYCARVKKTSHKTYLKQPVSLRKHICAHWANIAQVISLNDVVSDLFG